MMSDLPANVTEFRDRHGKIRYRFRRKGWKSAFVAGEPGTAEFHRSYAAIIDRGAALSDGAQSPRAVAPKSLDDLVRRHKKMMRWQKKGARTKLVQGRILDRFCDTVGRSGKRYGERPVAEVTVTWLERVFAQMADTPAAANVLRKVLAGLMDTACRLTPQWRTDNPVRLTEKFSEGEGFHTWTESEIAQFRATHPLGTTARLTLELALNTAGRRCNIATLTRDHLQGRRIVTNHAKGGDEASVMMLATTKAAIEALPAAPIKALITTQFGEPFTVAGLGNRMRKWCDEAGLPQCSLHGIRKALARRVAESGGTDAEGQAITGQKKPETFAYYRSKANRAVLADKALSNLASRFDNEQEESPGVSED